MAAETASKRWILTIVLVVIALAVGAGAMWLVQQASRISEIEDRLTAIEKQLDEIATAVDTSDSGTAARSEGIIETTPATSGETATDTSTTTPESTTTATGHTETAYTFVTGVRVSGGVTYVTLDYIQFLTGDAAAAAATAHGDESPPPNGYYIVNENPLLREFPLAAGVEIAVVYNYEGYSVPEGIKRSQADYVSGITGSMEGYYKSSYYIVEVENGTITALDQKYTP